MNNKILCFIFSGMAVASCYQDTPTPGTGAAAASVQTCFAPCEISFSANAQNATSYFWEFGDGQTSRQENPVHTFQEGGSYQVKLTSGNPGSIHGSSLSVRVYTLEWEKDFGGDGWENLATMVATPDGGFLLGGGSSSSQLSGSKSAENFGFTDYWIVKTDASGNKIWDKSFGGNYEDRLTSIVTTFDGGFLLGGVSQSAQSGNKTAENHSYSFKGDYWIVRTDANGNKLWDKSFGGNGDDHLTIVVATADRGFLLGGYTESGVSGNKTAHNYGEWDYWIVKIDENGNKLWDKSIGGEGNDYLDMVVATPDGGFLLGGDSYSGISGSKTSQNYGYYDYWVVKTDANGNIQWDKSFGGSENDNLTTMLATPDNGFLLGGFSFSNRSGNKTAEKNGLADYWIIKLDANGRANWDESFGQSQYDTHQLGTMVALNDGGFYLGGTCDSNGDGRYDHWIVNISGEGKRNWDMNLFSKGAEQSSPLLLNPLDESLLLGGGYGSYWVGKIK